MKKTVFTIAIIMLAACGLAAWTQGGRQAGPRRGGPGMPGAGPMMSCPAMAVMPPHSSMIDSLAKSLKLTSTQTAKLKKIAVGSDTRTRSLREAAGKASQALRASVLSASYSSNKTKQLAAKAEKAEAAVVGANIEEWTQIRSVLTAGQSAGLQKAMSSQHPGPDGPRPGFPPPPGQTPKGAR